eukprot:5268954-Prorocentrum_lima.AAC.1
MRVKWGRARQGIAASAVYVKEKQFRRGAMVVEERFRIVTEVEKNTESGACGQEGHCHRRCQHCNRTTPTR